MIHMPNVEAAIHIQKNEAGQAFVKGVRFDKAEDMRRSVSEGVCVYVGVIGQLENGPFIFAKDEDGERLFKPARVTEDDVRDLRDLLYTLYQENEEARRKNAANPRSSDPTVTPLERYYTHIEMKLLALGLLQLFRDLG